MTEQDRCSVGKLKSSVSLLQDAQIGGGGCSESLYKRLDDILYSIQDIIDELETVYD